VTRSVASRWPVTTAERVSDESGRRADHRRSTAARFAAAVATGRLGAPGGLTTRWSGIARQGRAVGARLEERRSGRHGWSCRRRSIVFTTLPRSSHGTKFEHQCRLLAGDVAGARELYAAAIEAATVGRSRTRKPSSTASEIARQAALARRALAELGA
jgi:hypothetical protein